MYIRNEQLVRGAIYPWQLMHDSLRDDAALLWLAAGERTIFLE